MVRDISTRRKYQEKPSLRDRRDLSSKCFSNIPQFWGKTTDCCSEIKIYGTFSAFYPKWFPPPHLGQVVNSKGLALFLAGGEA